MNRPSCTLWLSLAALLCASVLGGCGGDDEGEPYIDAIAPSSGKAGAAVELTGVRFCGPDAANVTADDSCATPPTGFVTFRSSDGEVRAKVTSWKGTHIKITVPTTATKGSNSVEVTVSSRTSNSVGFTVE